MKLVEIELAYAGDVAYGWTRSLNYRDEYYYSLDQKDVRQRQRRVDDIVAVVKMCFTA